MRLPNWLPQELEDWFRALKDEPDPITIRLATDHQMRGVWEWYSTVRTRSKRVIGRLGLDSRITNYGELMEVESPVPREFLEAMERAAYFPGKPNDMTPNKRKAFLGKIKKHASELIELLRDTEFDEGIIDGSGDVITDKLVACDPWVEQSLLQIYRAIKYSKNNGRHETVDYVIDRNGDVYQRRWNYPNSDLVSILEDLIAWTSRDDHFDLFHSVKAVRHSGVKARKTSYLEKLDTAFTYFGIDVPMTHYATITNIALDLPEDELVDEDSARKQLNRLKKRMTDQQ